MRVCITPIVLGELWDLTTRRDRLKQLILAGGTKAGSFGREMSCNGTNGTSEPFFEKCAELV
jgi:hypothetical protein